MCIRDRAIESDKKFTDARVKLLKADGSTKTYDTDKDYTKDTEAVENGVFYESKFRSAPYFDVMIDGINLLDTNFGS